MAKGNGSADALSGKSWEEWEEHCLREGPTWLYVVILLQSLLALRVSEALNLQGESFDKHLQHVRVAPLKTHGAVVKPILRHARAIISKLRAKGVSVRRSKRAGRAGLRMCNDAWKWSSGWLFPARSGGKPLDGNTVAKAIRRLRQKFQPTSAYVDKSRIRPHCSAASNSWVGAGGRWVSNTRAQNT
jgi:integrase